MNDPSLPLPGHSPVSRSRLLPVLFALLSMGQAAAEGALVWELRNWVQTPGAAQSRWILVVILVTIRTLFSVGAGYCSARAGAESARSSRALRIALWTGLSLPWHRNPWKAEATAAVRTAPEADFQGAWARWRSAASALQVFVLIAWLVFLQPWAVVFLPLVSLPALGAAAWRSRRGRRVTREARAAEEAWGEAGATAALSREAAAGGRRLSAWAEALERANASLARSEFRRAWQAVAAPALLEWVYFLCLAGGVALMLVMSPAWEGALGATALLFLMYQPLREWARQSGLAREAKEVREAAAEREAKWRRQAEQADNPHGMGNAAETRLTGKPPDHDAASLNAERGG